ncbi:hypothetical protein EJ08DRAFT_639492 [Tothia fuscella]|uniref:lytic cellulose monooxygenase (C4-dehydrogenating) n=1 Tax=Tothia fuscella TaxID=1048955 RepID=A0A9P4TVI3_9PEZI|nr:hypothetical protein EJ08DRAFT_639492 [Tothia fuscella]
MHNGPTLAHLAPHPSPNTTANELKFFKIFEAGYLPSVGDWGNEYASTKFDSFKIQLPSDIESGLYVLRTELITLHGNMTDLKDSRVKGQVQIYPHCFNHEITGGGTVVPEGVTFPGVYKADDAGLIFSPYMSYATPSRAAGIERNKYVNPISTRQHGLQLTFFYKPHQGHRNTLASTTYLSVLAQK